MGARDPDPLMADASAAELTRLKSEIVVQARELATIRWELSSILRQRPLSGRASQFKFSVKRRFPKYVQRIAGLRRTLRGALAAWRWPPANRAPAIVRTEQASAFLKRPILLIGEGALVPQAAALDGAHDVIYVEHGAGFTRSLAVPQADEPPLRMPADGSFVQWMRDDAHRLRDINTVVVDSGDDLSLGLLRGRLRTGQTLALTAGADTPTAASRVVELGTAASRDGSLSSYSDLPTAWLDPLDDEGRPIPAIVDYVTWPKISVVMVSFNQVAFLQEGLRSILDQGYPNLEFIVIDGKSTDGSIEVLERYRDRLSVLVIESDRGQSDGLNKGFDRATGDILTWVNSDDLLEPGALFRVAQAFVSYGVDMVAGGCRQIGLTRAEIITNHHNRLPFGMPLALPFGLLLDIDRFWFTGSFFYQPEVFFSREIWKRSGGKLRTDLNYILDYDLWVRMAAAGATIVHIPEFLACSRTHDQQKTTVGTPYMPEFRQLMREYAGRLIDRS
jgi:GT2 family glycosyltransferase